MMPDAELTPKPDRTVSCTCDYCGDEYEALKYDLERGKCKYCSHECSQKDRRSEDGVEYNGEWYYKNNRGYYSHSTKGTQLHRDKWENEIGPIPDGLVVHHIDGDPSNNDLHNLYLMPASEHARHHRLSEGEKVKTKCPNCGKITVRLKSRVDRRNTRYCSHGCAYEDARGESNPNSKLTEGEVREILVRYKNEDTIMRQLGDEYGVTRECISDIINGENWSHLHNGERGE